MAAWPDEIDLEITGIAQGGDGVGRWEGRAVFATGALPGETVRVRLREREKSFARGDVIGLHTVVSERVTSPCPLEKICGAADWRWVEYAAQQRYKATILKEQMRHIGGIEIDIAAVHGMEPTAETERSAGWAYRTTAELHAAEGKLGYYVPGSRRVADVPQCCLHHPLINQAIAALRPLLAPEVGLRGATLRCAPAAPATLAILDAARPPERLARRWMETCPHLRGVVHRDRSHTRTLAGQDHLVQELAGIHWHVGAGSFFQVNDRQTERLIGRVLELMQVSPGERLLDLFCGVGTFALPLARLGAHVSGVESYAQAVDDARRSALLNDIRNVDWHAGPVEEILETFDGRFDGAVLDPPRRGCAPAALRALLQLRPHRIVYVACHPGTLARDCKVLTEGGYAVERVEVIDLFPQTHHVESIVFLRNRDAKES